MSDSVHSNAHLLVGVDFSDGSRLALMEARQLASRLQAAVRLVHVREPLHDSETTLRDTAEQWLAATDVTMDQLHVRSGQPWTELARAAAASGAIAVVIGSHGRSGYQPVTLGSTASRVGLVAPCPTIVVNARTRVARPHAAHAR